MKSSINLKLLSVACPETQAMSAIHCETFSSRMENLKPRKCFSLRQLLSLLSPVLRTEHSTAKHSATTLPPTHAWRMSLKVSHPSLISFSCLILPLRRPHKSRAKSFNLLNVFLRTNTVTEKFSVRKHTQNRRIFRKQENFQTVRDSERLVIRSCWLLLNGRARHRTKAVITLFRRLHNHNSIYRQKLFRQQRKENIPSESMKEVSVFTPSFGR